MLSIPSTPAEPSYTIDEWCAHRKMSRAMFYKLEDQNRAPRTYNVGSRRFISALADAEWLRDREAEAMASEAA